MTSFSKKSLAIWLSFYLLTGTVAKNTCVANSTRLQLSEGPYQNYFYSDCHSSSHVVITSPLASSNLSIISPRLLVAWPSGNSGLVAYFEPRNGSIGSLGIRLQNSTLTGNALEPIYEPEDPSSGNPRVGVSGLLSLNSSATLTTSVLGSIRAVRDFAEGGGILQSIFQDALIYNETGEGGVSVSRTWLDNITTTYLSFEPLDGSSPVETIQNNGTRLNFGAGTYKFNASFDYPQLEQLSGQAVLNNASSNLLQENPEQTSSLSFLSYTEKLLAGSWRFLTYFGRDSMISLLLLQPILSEGQDSAVEAVLSAVIERLNNTDGTVCHEEVVGDYATFLNSQRNISSSDPFCDYKMIDTDYFLPVALKRYFVDSETGSSRIDAFFSRTASFLPENSGNTYANLTERAAEKIMAAAASFASLNGQTKENLIRLRGNEPVGQWRDSNIGLGGGRIPYDVNTALVPAGLRAVAALSRAGFFPAHPDWNITADTYAQVWEDNTLQFFEVSVPQTEAVAMVKSYAAQSSFPGPSQVESITSDVHFYGVALDGSSNQSIVRVVNTDDCFRHFLLNTTNQEQLSTFLSQTADHILRPFPAGLSSDVGLFVANPAYGGDPSYAQTFKNTDYHGTVVWSWQLAMMAQGLTQQLGRCEAAEHTPDFCNDTTLYGKIRAAYDRLWALIEANRAQLSGEVWSWRYEDEFVVEPLGGLAATESNIIQLWSLTFLSVRKAEFDRVVE